MKRFVIIAGETSGDTYGAQLINSLKLKFDEPIEFWGIGGEKMVGAGLNQLEKIDNISVVGFSEVLKNILYISKLLRRIAIFIYELDPVNIILIDFPGFNLNLAKKIKQYNAKAHITYFVSPQIWAWNEGRVKTIKKYIDDMLVIFPFEKEYYNQHNVNAKYVGHPFLDEWKHGDIDNLKNSIGVNKKKKIIGIFPGSRKEELEKHLPIYLETMVLIKKHRSDVEFALGLAPSFNKKDVVEKYNTGDITIVFDEPLKLLECSYLNIVTSGTISLQSTFMNIPCVVGYKLSRLSWYISKLLIKIEYISMTNIIANKMIVPELIQKDLTPINLANAVNKFLNDEEYYKKVQKNLINIKNIFAEKNNAMNNVALHIKNNLNAKI